MEENDKVKLAWKQHLNKWVSVAYKTFNSRTNEYKDYYYNGWLIDVNESGIIIKDKINGDTPLSFYNLSLLEIDEMRGAYNG